MAGTSAVAREKVKTGSTRGQEARFGAVALLVGVVAFAPIAIGTVHATTRTIVFVASALALILVLGERRLRDRPFAVTVPLVALGVAVIATAVQLVPLPPSVIRVLSPAAAETFAMTLGDHGWRPLSLDPGSTVGELAKLSAYLAFYAAASSWASRSDRRRILVVAVAAVATASALIGLAQAALGTSRILFFYEQQQQDWGPPVRGTFVNANNFGGLMALGAACALTLGMRVKSWRLPALTATLIINVAVMFSLSRSGIAATLFAQLLVFTLDRLELRRSGDAEAARQRTTVMIVGLAVIALAIVIGASRLRSEVSKTTMSEIEAPTSKFSAWQDAGELVRDFPWTGVGRGAFDEAFTRVSDVSGKVRYPFLENSYLQAVVDWGAPVALLLLVLAGWAAFQALRGLSDDPLAIGAVAGLAALAIHDVVDFSVDIPGVAFPALALAAVAFGRSTNEAIEGRRRIRVAAPVLLVPVLALLAAAAPFWWRPSDVDAAAFRPRVRNHVVPVETILAEGRALRNKHPADHYLHALIAARLAEEGHPETVRWLNQAIYLNPGFAETHVIAAEVLARAGRKSQALLEFQLAAAAARDPRPVWERVILRYPALDDLLAACPPDPVLTAALAEWLDFRGRGADAEQVWQRAAELDPTQLRAATELAIRAIVRRDADAAARRVKALAALDTGPTTQRLSARERILAGDLKGAARILESMYDRGAATLEVELELASALAARGRIDEARGRMELVQRRWSLDRTGRARVHEIRAEIERRAGNEHQYHWEMEQARRLREP